jgi:carbon monoxide dehydrogenase subunit G
MRLEDTFTIPAGHERSWELLTDLPAVARCLPGAQLQGIQGDQCTGAVKVKIGPIVMTYLGELEFTERSPEEGLMVMRATGKDKRSAGTVAGDITLRETSSNDQETAFSLDVTIDLTGKPAQFGRSAIQDVCSRLIEQFARNLAALVDEEPVKLDASTPRAGSFVSTPEPEAFEVLAGPGPRVIAAGAGALVVIAGLLWLALRGRRDRR